MSLEGRIFDICLMARSFLPKEHAFRLWRRINAAHCLGYVGLTQGKIYSRRNFLDPLLQDHQLLTPSELARINQIDVAVGGSCYREVLSWCIQDIKDYLSSLSGSPGLVYSETIMAKEIINQILMFRGKMGSIFDFADMPIPLIYTHLVVLIAWVFLPLYTFAVAANVRVSLNKSGDYTEFANMTNAAIAEILPALCVTIMIIFVVGEFVLSTLFDPLIIISPNSNLPLIPLLSGSRLVSDALADPFGKYLEDVTVLQYTTFSVVASRKVLMASTFDKTSLDEEMEMEVLRPDLGPAWLGRGLPAFRSNDKDEWASAPEVDHYIKISAGMELGEASNRDQDLEGRSEREAILQELVKEGLEST